MITSADNPKFKQARALLERRGRREYGQCLAEGVRLIEDALRAGIEPALIFFAPAPAVSPRAEALLAQAASARIPAWELSRDLFDTISDTVTSQGVIAVVPIPAPPAPAQRSLVLVLDGVRDPGNLGTTLRSAEAAGSDLAVLLRGCTDPFSPKSLRAGMGAHFRLPVAAGLTWEAAAEHVSGCELWLADARGEQPYDTVDWTRPCALAVSGETTGASPALAAAIRGRVAIPMLGETESLNVAMAATVLLFEAGRQRRVADAAERGNPGA